MFYGHTNWIDYTYGIIGVFVLVVLKELKQQFQDHPKLHTAVFPKIFSSLSRLF